MEYMIFILLVLSQIWETFGTKWYLFHLCFTTYCVVLRKWFISLLVNKINLTRIANPIYLGYFFYNRQSEVRKKKRTIYRKLAISFSKCDGCASNYKFLIESK